MAFIIKKIYPIFIVLAAIVLISACKEDTEERDRTEQELRFFNLYVGANYPGETPQANGLYFIEHKAGTGSFPDSDDWLLVNHVCYKIPGDIVYESYIENVAMDNHLDPDTTAIYGPYKLLNGSRNEGLTEGLTLMREGAQVTMFFTSDLGYGVEGNENITPYQSLKYEIELLKVIKDIDVYELARIDAYLDTVPQYDTIHDPESDAIMYYIVDHATNGTPVVNDSLVEIGYKGYLMDGRVFDASTADNPFNFKVGNGDVITGWDLGLPRLRVGEKARFIIPYQMAYGETEHIPLGSRLRAIPPYETLIFDIEVISVEEDPGDDPEGEV